MPTNVFIRRMGTYVHFPEKKDTKNEIVAETKGRWVLCSGTSVVARASDGSPRETPTCADVPFSESFLAHPPFFLLFLRALLLRYMWETIDRPLFHVGRKRRGGTFQISFIGGTVDRHELPTQQDL